MLQVRHVQNGELQAWRPELNPLGIGHMLSSPEILYATLGGKLQVKLSILSERLRSIQHKPVRKTRARENGSPEVGAQRTVAPGGEGRGCHKGRSRHVEFMGPLVMGGAYTKP